MNQSQQAAWSNQHQQHQVPQSVPTPPQQRNGPLRFLQTPRAFLRSVVQRMGQERPLHRSLEPHPGHHSNLSPLRLFQGQNPQQQRCSMTEQPPLAPQLFRNSWTHQDSPRSPTGNRRPPQSTFRREPSRDSFIRPQASRQDLAHQGQQSSMVGVYSNLSSPVMAPDSLSRLLSYLPALRGVSTAPPVLNKAHQHPKSQIKLRGA